MLGLPKTCMHCGVNFMKRNPRDENEKICNSCQNKENQKQGVNKMANDSIKLEIIIELDHPDFSKLEELCNNQGMTFAEYFLNLHKIYSVIEKEKQSIQEVQEQPQKKKIKS